MNKKTGNRWKLTQLKVRSRIFLRRNGLQVFVVFCMTLLGAAALIIFTGEEKEQPNTHVNQSNDERLEDALKGEKVTVPPVSGSGNDKDITHITDFPKGSPAFTPDPGITIIPDFTPAPTAVAEGKPEMQFQPPVDGSISKVFAINSLIYSETLNQWMTHSGVDIACPKGTEVRCIADGTVENVYNDDLLGTTVVITHSNGMVSVYANLKEEVIVKIGDTVKARTVIGSIGETAIGECLERSHLHFEVHVNGEPVNPEGLMLFKQE